MEDTLTKVEEAVNKLASKFGRNLAVSEQVEILESHLTKRQLAIHNAMQARHLAHYAKESGLLALIGALGGEH